MRLLLVATSLAALATMAQDLPTTHTFQRSDQGLQRTPPVDTPSTGPRQGEVIVHQDERIGRLMEDFAKREHVLKGYRVQIFLGSDRGVGQQVRREFLVKHGAVPAYEDYLAPNFRVRVGDCRTRLEAANLLQAIKADYPVAYVVPDEIAMPRLE